MAEFAGIRLSIYGDKSCGWVTDGCNILSNVPKETRAPSRVIWRITMAEPPRKIMSGRRCQRVPRAPRIRRPPKRVPPLFSSPFGRRLAEQIQAKRISRPFSFSLSFRTYRVNGRESRLSAYEEE